MFSGESDSNKEKAEIKGVKLPDLVDNLPEGVDPSNFGLLMDVYMQVTVELGRTQRQVKDILGMTEGTIITLDKLAGESVDILVNGKVMAKGEVVVIDENFGVRITEIIKSEIIKSKNE